MTLEQTQESTEYLKMKPGVGGRAPPVTKEPLNTDRPPQLLPLVQCYPSQDSSPGSFRRHTCYSQTSAQGKGPEGNQVYPGVASFISRPKSQAVLLCWPQRVSRRQPVPLQGMELLIFLV